MKTNKMLPDSSISKVWENFRKMNGIVIEFLANNWVSQSNGTFTNTVSYEGFTSDEILEVDLYDDGTLTETQITEYDSYITEFNILDGMIIAIATTKPTEDIIILCRGEIVGEKVVVNGGGSSDINASNVSCSDKDGNNSNVQKELDEQNKNLGGLRFGVDGDGNGGYYKADDSFVPFKKGRELIIAYTLSGDNRLIEKTYTVPSNGKIKFNGFELPVKYVDCKVNNETKTVHWINDNYAMIDKELTVNKGDVVYMKFGNGSQSGATGFCFSAYFEAT